MEQFVCFHIYAHREYCSSHSNFSTNRLGECLKGQYKFWLRFGNVCIANAIRFIFEMRLHRHQCNAHCKYGRKSNTLCECMMIDE